MATSSTKSASITIRDEVVTLTNVGVHGMTSVGRSYTFVPKDENDGEVLILGSNYEAQKSQMVGGPPPRRTVKGSVIEGLKDESKVLLIRLLGAGTVEATEGQVVPYLRSLDLGEYGKGDDHYQEAVKQREEIAKKERLKAQRRAVLAELASLGADDYAVA